MVKVSIIGKGNFGTKIENCIKDNVTFVSPNDADWIIISTPSDLHSVQVETWLSKKKNVFCEKAFFFRIFCLLCIGDLQLDQTHDQE